MRRRKYAKSRTAKANPNIHASPTAIKRVYKNSIKGIKKHPKTVGLLTIGTGVLSGMYLLMKAKKRKKTLF